jgi:hypothetical protein
MDSTVRSVIEELREGRDELMSVPSPQLVGQHIVNWYKRWQPAFKRFDTLTGRLDGPNLRRQMDGFWETQDSEVANERRRVIVERIDQMIPSLNASQKVRPVLDELILQVKDNKLSVLLNEFNSIREKQPNLAGIGFRTIFNTIVQEMAKKIAPKSDWATQDDLGHFEDCIAYSLNDEDALFSSGTRKHIRRYRNQSKDTLDNVAHKPRVLVQKDELEHAVTVLNSMLHELVAQ